MKCKIMFEFTFFEECHAIKKWLKEKVFATIIYLNLGLDFDQTIRDYLLCFKPFHCSFDCMFEVLLEMEPLSCLKLFLFLFFFCNT